MIRKLTKLFRDESGITALETAIILIAFVVVASVFAFTILSAGTFSTERGKEAIYAGLEEVSSSMELKGSVIATTTHTSAGYVDVLIFTVGVVAGGDAIDLTDTAVLTDGNLGDSVVVFSYQDNENYQPKLEWDVSWVIDDTAFGGTADNLLENGELAEIAIWLTDTTSTNMTYEAYEVKLESNTEFSLDMKPPSGAVINIQRKTPASIDSVMDLQ